MSMRWLKWVSLGLYVAIAVTLCIWVTVGSWGNSDFLLVLAWVGIPIIMQFVFLFGAGTRDLHQPISKRRLLIPVAVASLALTFLVAFLYVALGELHCLSGMWGMIGNTIDDIDRYARWWIMLSILCVCWGFCGTFLYTQSRHVDRYKALKRMILWVLVVGVVVPLACLLIVIATRGGGGLGGFGAAIVMLGAFCIMFFWALGLAIALLFLKERYVRELELKGDREKTAA